MLKLKEIVYGVLITLISIIVCLGLLEVAVRRLHPDLKGNVLNIFQADQELGWRLKRNLSVGISTAEFKMHIASNKDGFRDADHVYDKPAATLRIIGLGDSFLFGYGVEQSQTVLARLGSLLEKTSYAQAKIETINFGVPGYNINQYDRLTNNEIFKYHPDIVILFFYINDFKSNDKYDYVGVSREGFLITHLVKKNNSFNYFRHKLISGLKANSYLYLYLYPKLKIISIKYGGVKPTFNINLFRTDQDFYQKYSSTFNLITRIKEKCEAHQARFLLCFIPYKEQIDARLFAEMLRIYNIDQTRVDWQQPREKLATFCNKRQIPFIDLTPGLSKYQVKEVYFGSDVHWNEHGHKVSAQCLSDFLSQLPPLPSPGGGGGTPEPRKTAQGTKT